MRTARAPPIVRHDAQWGMVYSPNPPYQVLRTRHIDWATMQRLRRFSRYWDLIANSGNFVETAPMVWAGGRSPFWSFLSLSDWIFQRVGRQHGIALQRLAELLFQFLLEQTGSEPLVAAQSLWRDYQRGGRSDLPEFLRPYVGPSELREMPSRIAGLSRQARHLRVTDP